MTFGMNVLLPVKTKNTGYLKPFLTIQRITEPHPVSKSFLPYSWIWPPFLTTSYFGVSF